MTADGIEERRSTIARIEAIGGLSAVWLGAAPDDWNPPRDSNDKVLPYVVVDFGAPIKTARDRGLAYGEKGQPHLLPANIACISGDPDWSMDVMKAVLDTLLDWAPSDTSDPYEAQGGYGSRRPATGNTPSRFIEGLFMQTVVNQTLPATP